MLDETEQQPAACTHMKHGRMCEEGNEMQVDRQDVLSMMCSVDDDLGDTPSTGEPGLSSPGFETQGPIEAPTAWPRSS